MRHLDQHHDLSADRSRRQRCGAVAGALVVAVVLAGCGDPGAAGGQDSPASVDRPLPRAFDPPVMFDAAHPVPLDTALPSPPLLDGANAWAAASAGLVRIDLRTGQAGPPAAPSGDPPATSDPSITGPMTVSNPVITGTGPDRVVLAAYPEILSGSGTTASIPAVDVVAADPVSGAKRFDVSIPTPTALQASGRQQSVAMVVPAAPTASAGSPLVAVLTVGSPTNAPESDTWTSFGIDLTSRKVVWTAPRFLAQVVDDRTAVGLQSVPASSEHSTRTDARGLALAVGTTHWTVQHVESIGFAAPHR